jgi:hypothetical protein
MGDGAAMIARLGNDRENDALRISVDTSFGYVGSISSSHMYLKLVLELVLHGR